MKLQLVGSRSRGTNRPDSDWDIVVDSPVPEKFGTGDTAIYWGKENLSQIVAEARERFNIPDGAEIDIFIRPMQGRWCKSPWRIAFASWAEFGFNEETNEVGPRWSPDPAYWREDT